MNLVFYIYEPIFLAFKLNEHIEHTTSYVSEYNNQYKEDYEITHLLVHSNKTFKLCTIFRLVHFLTEFYDPGYSDKFDYSR
jgi:hypothetical protein